MIKVKTTGQILPFKNGTALPSPAQVHGILSLYFIRKGLSSFRCLSPWLQQLLIYLIEKLLVTQFLWVYMLYQRLVLCQSL